MHLLFLYDCLYPETIGGVEHRNAKLAEALARRGHRVTLAGWGATIPPHLPEGVSYLLLPHRAPLHDADGKRGIGPTLRFARAVAGLDLSPYDAIETANIPYLHLFPLAFKAACAKKPLIVTWHEYFGPLWKSYKNPLVAPVFALLERAAAHLGFPVAVSDLTAGRVAQARGQSAIPVLANGVDLESIQAALEKNKWDPRLPPPPRLRATGRGDDENGSREDGKKKPTPDPRSPNPDPPFLFAGRLIPEKQVDLLIRAVGLLSDPQSPPPDPLLSIVGDGPDRARLEALTRELGLEARIRFEGRLPTAQDVWALVARAKIAVQPSAREGFGLFPLEAMALGKPVVYCKGENNALSSLVRTEKEGIEAQPTPESLAETLLFLLKKEDVYARLSANACARAEAFAWPALAIQAEAFFTNAVASFRRSIR